MMQYLLKICLLISALFLGSCAFTPLAPTTTAKGVGGGVSQVDFGLLNKVYYSRYTYGLSDVLDVGATLEFGDYMAGGIQSKYTFNI